MSYLLATRREAGVRGPGSEPGRPAAGRGRAPHPAVVGVTEVEFLDHTDGLVEYGIALRRDLAAAFRRLQPDLI